MTSPYQPDNPTTRTAPVKKVDLALYTISVLIGVGIAFHGHMVPEAPQNTIEEAGMARLVAKFDVATNQLLEWKSFDMVR